MKRILVTAILASVWGFLSSGLASEKNLSGYAIYMDQDFFVPSKNEDRDYTMGFAVEWFWKAEPPGSWFPRQGPWVFKRKGGPEKSRERFSEKPYVRLPHLHPRRSLRLESDFR